jgi:cytosol alanyl aminopeptidase
MALLAALAALALVADAAPTLRLPGNVRPVRQAIDLSLDPGRESFSGSVAIELELAEPIPVLWLNAVALQIQDASLDRGGKAIRLRVVPGNDDFVGFAADEPLPAGKAQLRVRFEGLVSRRDDEGVFAVQEEGSWYLFTQFEAVQARRAFPCFDEPGYKIPWDVTLRVPRGAVALSNSPETSSRGEGARDVHAFARTPPLPSYLVAFAVGPFDLVDVGPSGRKRVPTRLVVPRGRGADTAWARSSTPRILALLEDYFDRPYPYDKLDEVAIPGIGFAMEHPGLVTFGQSAMVKRPRDETISSRRGWVSLAAHELAHQWVGDLVTMAWWDDTWLNESFASWLGEKVTDRFQPDWGVAIDRASNRSDALFADGLPSARRIRQPITSKDDIFNAFDGVTYGKGEAVLEMVEAWLGEQLFARGVKAYIERHAWGNATAADFIAALSTAAGRDVGSVLSSFLDQTGAPVVSAELRCDGEARLVLAQRPYRPLGSAVEAKTWGLPVCVRAAGREGRTCTLLTGATGELRLDGTSCPAWFSANAGATGYYRTMLSAEAARRSLETGALGAAERVALAGDVAALMLAGEVPAADALGLVPLFARDPDHRVVSAGGELTAGIAGLVPDAQQPQFEARVRAAYGERAHALGWAIRPGDGDDVRLLRRAVLSVMTNQGRDPELGQQAAALVGRWLEDPSVLDPELVATAIGAASASSDRPLVERLKRELFLTTDRERRELLIDGLGGVRDTGLARELVPLTLDDRLDPRESITILWRLGAHRETRRVAFDFLKANYDALAGRLPWGEASPVLDLPWVGAGLCAEDTHAEIEAFFGARAKALVGGPRVLAQALDAVDQCVARARVQQPALAAALESRPRL